MKKFIALIGLAVASLSLTGCDLGYSFGGSGVSFDTIEGFIEYLNGDEGNCEVKVDMGLLMGISLVTEMKIDNDILYSVTPIPAFDEEGNLLFDEDGKLVLSDDKMESYVQMHSNNTETTYSKDANGNWIKSTGPSTTIDPTESEDLNASDFTKNDDGTYSMTEEGMTTTITLGSNPKVVVTIGDIVFSEMFNFGKVKLTLPNATDVTPEANA